MNNFIEFISHRIMASLPEPGNRHIRQTHQTQMLLIRQQSPSADYAYTRQDNIHSRHQSSTYLPLHVTK